MPEINHVVVETRSPSGRDDLGQCEEGFYTLSDGVVTMCSAEGDPLRDANGNLVTHKLGAGENHVTIAKRLRLKIWREASDDPNGFNRTLHYGPAFNVV